MVLIDVRTFNDVLKISYYVQSLKKSLRHVKITEPVVFYICEKWPPYHLVYLVSEQKLDQQILFGMHPLL